MSLLSIVQDAADAVGVAPPTGVVGASDPLARQFLRLANQEGKSLSRRAYWEILQTELTFTAVATEAQTGVIPDDFDRMIPKTFWNRTQDRIVVGPLTAQKWQQLKTGLYTSIWDSYRIRGGSIIMHPAPRAGDSMAFEYMSNEWAQSSDEATTSAAWVADTDTARLDEELMTLGLIWRWKAAKGLDYAEAKIEYESELEQRIANDGVMSDLDLDASGDGSSVYDPNTQEGNWA